MKYLLLIFMVPLSFGALGQKLDSKNSFQLELGGHGLLYSLNYERIIFNGEKFKTTGQLGIAYYPPAADLIQVWIPILVNELRSFGNNHIEFGIGYILTNETKTILRDTQFVERLEGFLTGRLGYRYQKSDKNLFFRLAFTPIIEYSGYWEVHPTGGGAIGFSF